MKKSKIIDCEFIDAGGRWERGKPGTKPGNAYYSFALPD